MDVTVKKCYKMLQLLDQTLHVVTAIKLLPENIPHRRSSTSRNIYKESQNPSVTKSYSVDFNPDAELSCNK